MISIKVCRLSDLTNNAIIILLLISFLVLTFNTIINSIDKISINFIEKAIADNFGVKKISNFTEKMLASKLPTNLLNSSENIEKEFDLEDNIIGSKVDVNTKDEVNFNGAHDLVSPYLLECQKLSDSKYKIGTSIINNYTGDKLDLKELEKALFTKMSKDCRVLIYHTHTSESYSDVENYSDLYRTEDSNCNVVKVGDALKQELNKYGIYVRHDTTIHDYPSYNGAYKASLKTVENILKNENYDIIIDIHRDALASNSQYRPTAEINGETVAKLMFVVGTNAAGLKHDDWIENLKFALSVQERGNEIYPGLFRDMHLSTSRYNQHTSNKTIILEVGATGNTIKEACLSMKYFASLINSIKEID